MRNKDLIEKMIREIADLRRMGIETEDFTKEEIDEFINTNLKETCETVDNMPVPDFIESMLERMFKKKPSDE